MSTKCYTKLQQKCWSFVVFQLSIALFQSTGAQKTRKSSASKQIRFNLILFHPSMPRQLAKTWPSPVAARVLPRLQSLATCSCSWSNIPDSWYPSNAAIVRHLHPPGVARFLNPADDVVVPFRPKRHCPEERRSKGDSVVSGAWLHSTKRIPLNVWTIRIIACKDWCLWAMIIPSCAKMLQGLALNPNKKTQKM